MLLGALAGGQKDVSETNVNRHLDAASAGEIAARDTSYGALEDLKRLVAAGPGAQDVTASNSSNASLAALLKSMMQTGGTPTQAQTNTANAYTSQVYQGQQNQLLNAFKDQDVQASRSAGARGMSAVNPASIANSLSQTRQQRALDADQGASAQRFALSIPQTQLSTMQKISSINGGLASQAMRNQQSLLTMSQQLRDSDRNFRNATAATQGTTQSGGGVKGALTGGMAENAQALKIFSSIYSGGLTSMAGGMGGGASQTSSANTQGPQVGRNYSAIA